MNRSKDLAILFKAYMARKERECSYTSYRSDSYYNNLFNDGNNISFKGVIFFYEWSDVSRTPIRYFSLSLFEKFLSESGLMLEPWQRDFIKRLDTAYITCRPGGRELIVRNGYDYLKQAVLDYDKDKKTTALALLPNINNAPVVGNNMRMSPMYKEQYY